MYIRFHTEFMSLTEGCFLFHTEFKEHAECSFFLSFHTESTEYTELRGALLSHHAEWNTSVASRFLCNSVISVCEKHSSKHSFVWCFTQNSCHSQDVFFSFFSHRIHGIHRIPCGVNSVISVCEKSCVWCFTQNPRNTQNCEALCSRTMRSKFCEN